MDSHRIDTVARLLAITSTRRKLIGLIVAAPALLASRRARATEEPICVPPLVLCGGECVNLLWDEANCGVCGRACAPFQNCDAGTCVPGAIFCIFPETPCNGECVNLSTDPENCGICGHVCPSGTTCVDGVCWGEAMECVPPLVKCGDECVDLNSSFANCGACGNVCPGIQDSACCFGTCVRLFSDPYNCGGCGNVCTEHSTCVQSSGVGSPPNGICVCIDGYTACGEGCFDLSSDFYNCGGCFVSCAPGEVCQDGACTGIATAEPTATREPTPTATPENDRWSFWTGRRPQHGAVIYQRRPLPGDDPIAMGGGPVGPAYIRSDFARLAALGASYVTLSIPLPVDDRGSVIDEELDHLDALIEHATDADLAVVIAPRTGPGRPEASLARHIAGKSGGCLFDPETVDPEPETIWQSAEAREAWADGWSTLSRRYAANEQVIGYELMSLAHPPSRTEWKRLTDALIEAIRRVDDETPILLHAPGLPARALSNRLTRDALTVHTVDWFAPQRLMTQVLDGATRLTYPGRFDAELDGERGRFDQAWLAEQLEPISEFKDRYDMPVAIGAYGLPRWQPGAADYLGDQIDRFDELGVNSALWLWYPAVWPAQADAFDVTRGPDPDQHDAVDNELLEAIQARW